MLFSLSVRAAFENTRSGFTRGTCNAKLPSGPYEAAYKPSLGNMSKLNYFYLLNVQRKIGISDKRRAGVRWETAGVFSSKLMHAIWRRGDIETSGTKICFFFKYAKTFFSDFFYYFYTEK